MKKYIFVCGCPRSGTTALWRLLAGDKRIVIGVERYGNLFFSKDFINEHHFTRERFLNIRQGDTFYNDLGQFNSYYDTIRDRFDDAQYTGDKIPKLYEYFHKLNNNFPAAKVVFIFRNIFDVATSYKARLKDHTDDWRHDVQKSIEDWNRSLQQALEFKQTLNMHIIQYERFFIEGQGLDELYEFLDLDVSAENSMNFNALKTRSVTLENERTRDLNALEVERICSQADFDSYRKLKSIL